jgi:topoisomerase IA-like protein
LDPYIAHTQTGSTSLSKDFDPYDVTLDEAMPIIVEKTKSERGKNHQGI